MICRLFIDEVGNDDVDHPQEQYLSLTGAIAKRAGCERQITPRIEAIKAEFFGHTPPAKTVVLHRRELVRREPPFQALRDEVTNARWEAAVLTLLDDLPYRVITVMIDKHAHRERYKVWRFNPYHYCMTALLERYVTWLRRRDWTGDVVVEPRFKSGDKKLKNAFTYFREHGTDNVNPREIASRLTSRELKFEPKSSNDCGLQLVELIAHASHHGTKSEYTAATLNAAFGKQIYEVLKRKRYFRNPKTSKIDGWGQKWLP